MTDSDNVTNGENTTDSTFTRNPRPSGCGPVALIVLDGFGLRAESTGNAVAQARKPVFDRLWGTYPHTTLQASGEAVGLPEGQFGNSEVGHSNIGAGRILYQDLTRINRDIQTGEFMDNPILLEAMKFVQNNDSSLHLAGLLSEGGVHSHINHLLALLRMAADMGLKSVFVHAFLDGRDVAPTSGRHDIQRLLTEMEKLGVGRLATMQGRYYAMDRDNRWERTEKAYRAMVYGDGKHGTDALQGLEDSYADGVTDEFIQPYVLVDEQGMPVGPVQDGDSVILFNFRPDRAIQISRVFTNQDFQGFDRGPQFPQVHYVCMTKFSETVGGTIAYASVNLDNTLGEVLSQNGLTQLRAAETEKFPHVTFFFSGGREAPFPGEARVLIPSPKVATYDLQPEMSAYGLAAAVAAKMRSGEMDVLILNFANPDMVGHTGNLQAATLAVEAADTCLGQVLQALHDVGGVAFVTADHGNADIMIDPETGEPCTTHTVNPVPLILTTQEPGLRLRADGVLADLAPTMLDLLGLQQPQEMTGTTLLIR